MDHPLHDLPEGEQPGAPGQQRSDPVFRSHGIDWRVWLGLVLTALYLLSGAYHVLIDVGWNQFRAQRLDAQGSFLEGAFALLAFLWLVFGFFLQHRAAGEQSQHRVAVRRDAPRR